MNDAVPDEPLFARLCDDDPELIDAVSVAKRTLPQFLDAFSKRRFPTAVHLVKVPFLDRSNGGDSAIVRTLEIAAQHPTEPTCHLWLTVSSVLEDLIFCSVVESPPALKLTTHDSFVVESELIEDWMINEGSVAYGGFSMRVVRSRLPITERRRFDDCTGIREFKEIAP